MLATWAWAEPPHRSRGKKLVKGSGYSVVCFLAQLNRDELVQPLRVGLTSTRLLLFFPRGEIGRITHHDQADAM